MGKSREKRSISMEAWIDYKANPTEAMRAEIITTYLGLVRYVCTKVIRHVSPNVEFDELVSYGAFGLMDAVEKYDPHTGNKFETYAVQRIRGAIIDELRSADWVPRSVRSGQKLITAARYELYSELGREPTLAEISERSGVPTSEFFLYEVRYSHTASLEEIFNGSGDMHPADTGLEDPEINHEIEITRRLVAEAIDALPERERQVFSSYYFDRLTYREIGDSLGLADRVVGKINDSAVMMVREFLAFAR